MTATYHQSPSSKTVIEQLDVCMFFKTPQLVVCPKCHANVRTKISERSGKHSWCAIASIIPCRSSDLDIVHECPNCKAYLGTYKKDS